MWPEDGSESDVPHQGRQRRVRRIEILRQLKRIRDEAASEEAARDARRAVLLMVNLPTEEVLEQMRSIEASEQHAAARRQQRWEELQNELFEIRRMDRARRTSTPRRLNGDGGREQAQAVGNSPQQSSPPHVSDSGSLSPDGPTQPASRVENGVQSADSISLEGTEVGYIAGVGDEADASDDPSATFSSIRWILRKDLGERGILARGITLYRSEVTDAIYYLNHLGEKVWLVDENGDCIIAQDQNLD